VREARRAALAQNATVLRILKRQAVMIVQTYAPVDPVQPP
jgi:hypothetical protein